MQKTPRRSTKPEAVSPKPEPKTPLPEGTSRSGRKIKPKKFIDEEMEELSPIAEPPTKKTKSIGSDEEQPEPVQEEQQPVKEVEQETPVKKAPVQKNHSPKKTPAVVRRENGTNRRSDPSYKIVHPVIICFIEITLIVLEIIVLIFLQHEIQDIKETITQSYGGKLLINGLNIFKFPIFKILFNCR